MLLDAGLVVVLVAVLATARVSPAVGFATFVAVVALLGRVPFRTVLDLLSDPALVAVICLVLFSAILGRIGWLRRLLFERRSEGSVRWVLARFLAVTGLVSAVMPNTAVVGAFMGPAATHPRLSPHLLLMPLSFMALAAGVMTPFGTSANLVVVGQAERFGVNLGPLDFLVPGIVTAGAVYATLLIASPWLLRGDAASGMDDRELFHVEARVPEGSPLVGRTILENRLRSLGRFFLAEVLRGERILSPVEPTEVLQAGDVLVFVGDVRFIEELQGLKGLELPTARRGAPHENLLHAVVAANSLLVGMTLREIRFRARYDASVLAIRRGGARLSGKLGEVRLAPGDLLVLAAGRDFAARDDLRGQLHIVETAHPGQQNMSFRSSLIVMAGFGAFLVAAFTEAVDFALATLLLVGFALAGGWLGRREVQRIFPFELVIVLWGSLVLGTLIAGSGVAAATANLILALAPSGSPLIALILVFILTWLLTEVLSNTSAALAALPVALEIARAGDASPTAFALAVAFGASASFVVPFGYQTHLMVMGPGSYRFSDFAKLGFLVFLAYAVAGLTGIVLWRL